MPRSQVMYAATKVVESRLFFLCRRHVAAVPLDAGRAARAAAETARPAFFFRFGHGNSRAAARVHTNSSSMMKSLLLRRARQPSRRHAWSRSIRWPTPR